MKRKYFLFFSFISIAVLVFSWLAFGPSSPRINRESYKLISNGMSKRQVEDILRASPGDHGSGEIIWRAADPNPDTEEWLGDNVGIQIFFSGDKKVVGQVVFEISREKRTWLDRIRDFFLK